MKKYLKPAAFFVAGCLVTGMLFTIIYFKSAPTILKEPNIAVFANLIDGEEESPALLLDALEVARLIGEKDYEDISAYVHPDFGVYFVPYSTVVPEEALHFSSESVHDFSSNGKTYVWGTVDGVGSPISMTPGQYFERYVYDMDYVNAPVIGINTVMRCGNSLENVKESFPNASFVEFHFPGTEENSGIDWRSLKLVFEEYKGKNRLVAIIHSEWTV